MSPPPPAVLEFMRLRSLRSLSVQIGISVETLLASDAVWVSEQMTVADAFDGWMRHLEEQS